MWYLISLDNPDIKYGLLGGKSYIVGRRDCDILVAGDASVSRKHAELISSHTEADLVNVKKLPILKLKDLSKFGTWVSKEKVSGSHILKDGDEVHFGSAKSAYIVVYEPLVITTSAGFEPAVKKAIKHHMAQLGGHMVSEWTNHCALLLMKKISVTIKVICALLSEKPIVTPDYLNRYIEYVEGKEDKPDPEVYLPNIAETQLDPNEVSFKQDPRRKQLFHGMKFIFLNNKQFKKMGLAIELGGGTPILCEEGGEDSLLVENGTVVMNCEPEMQELSQKGRTWVTHVQKILKRRGKHMIQDSELGYAVLYCSTEKHCNPDYQSDTQRPLPGIPSQSLSQMDPFLAETQTPSRPCPKSKKPNQGSVSPNKGSSSKRPASPVAPTVVKEEPISQPTNTPARTNNKRGRVEETEDVSISTATPSKRIKVEPVTPKHAGPSLSKPRQECPKYEEKGGEAEDGRGDRKLSPRRSPRARSPTPPPSTSPNVSPRSSPKPRRTSPKPPSPAPAVSSRTTTSKTDTVGRGKQRKILEFTDTETEMSSRSQGQGLAVKEEIGQGDNNSSEAVVKTSSSRQKKGRQQEADREVEDTETDVKAEDMPLETSRRRGSPPPRGFLSSRHTAEGTVKNEYEVEPELPSRCIEVDFVSLVVRRPEKVKTSSDCPAGFTRWKGKLVRNFKKFKKAGYAGSDSLPRIIGGSDLEVHEGSRSSEMEDWFRDALQAESQHTAEDRRAQDLFDWEPNASKKRGR